ncbi:hypothetical protein ACLB2K_057585 [Fragaria x ananassa]
MFISFVLLAFLGLFACLYNALVTKPEKLRSILRKQGIVGPPPTFLLGNIREIKKAQKSPTQDATTTQLLTSHNLAATLFPFFEEWRSKYGKVFNFSLGNTQILYVNESEAVREITTCTSLDLGKPTYQFKERGPLLGQGILTSNGAVWAHQRKVLAPQLYMDKVKGMINLITESAITLQESWKKRIDEEGGVADINIDEDMRSFSGDVISRACFGSNFASGQVIFHKLRALQEAMSRKCLATGIPGMRHLPTKNRREAWGLEKEVRNLILKVVKQRVEGVHEKDLLQMVLESTQNSDLSQAETDRFIVDNCKNIYLAGYETTAVSATWLLMLLASNQEWQERVRAEVLQVCGGQIPDADMLRKMKQLTMVIHESLRLYPPVSVVSREAFMDMKFAGIHVPKGVNLWVMVLTLHTDPELPHLYMPFGVGPRVCLGQNLAMIELKILVALILSKFSVSLSSKYCHKPAISWSLILSAQLNPSMAATIPLFQFVPTKTFQTKLQTNRLLRPTKQRGNIGFSVITCSSNGRGPDSVKSVEQLAEEKKRAELSARIASGEFTVNKTGYPSELKNGLLKLGVPREVLDFLFNWGDMQQPRLKIPEAKGSVSAVQNEAFFIPLYELYLTYGGIFRLTFGPKSFLIVSDPAIAKHILRDNAKAYSKGILAEILEFVMGKGLIPADGEIWRVRRRAIVPALHLKYVTAMINLFGQATERLCQKLDTAASDGEDVEMESLFSRLTLDIIGKALFNYDFDSLTNDTGIVEAVYTVLREAEDRSVAPIPFWEIPIWKDISPRQKKVAKALKLINVTLDDLIAICKRMVDEEELQFHEEYMNEQDPSILHFLLASGDDVSSKQLRDDLMTMLIAGHETSAAVLTWTFFLLSKEPRVMSKLQEEVDFVLGDRIPTIEDMKKLKYATRVINESLRLYPQPPVLIRRSLEDDRLGEYPIKRNEDIFISVWNLHRSPTLWDDADKFKPERWPLDGPNPNETNQNFSYLPFGGGPRKCVGDMFATYENVVALTMLVRRFNFQIALGAPEVKMTTGATIHTTEGLNMTVTRRIKPRIVPTLEVPAFDADTSVGVSKGDSLVGQKGI